MNLQPNHLSGTNIWLEPLQRMHFEELYSVAADPLIWEQHPNPNRYQKEVFTSFFEGALASGGAFIIRSMDSGKALGSTRLYDYNRPHDEIKIGYTFFSRDCWGKGINKEVKTLLLNYAFIYVEKVIFHVGAQNIRSQIAMEKLGAKKIAEEMVAYYSEPDRLNYVYEMRR
ncbi:MAG: GNAT family N-acetyltransferase [Bacteroidetes bacterium]|nr:GNAT family N-acetyltransferase [Bacteroidota bacterium]